MDSVNMPKVTPIMAAAFLTWVVSQAIAYGWLKTMPSEVVLSASATILAVGISWAEAHLRGKRAIAHATAVAASVASSSTTTTPLPPA